MKMFRSIILMLVIISLIAYPHPAHADDESPWGEILNPDGSIRWDLLSDLGTVSESADWMDITLPGGMVLDLDATYHRYQTPSGNILVLPSPATLFFMAVNPVESGLSGAESMLGDGAAILAMLVGPSLNSDQLAQLATMGYTDPQAFFQAVIDGQENIWSIVNFTYLFEILRMSFNSGFLVNALLLYLNGVANCASLPGGCAGLVVGCSDGSCVPETPICPAPTISQAPATLAIQKAAPENPLVVGQDPEKRGADIQASASIPPVIFTWYEQVQDPPTCESASSGDGEGCPGPGSRYDNDWDPSMEGNPAYEVVDGEIHCIEHVEILPEPITEVQANAQLSPESRYWILNDLASKYYEAYIHQPRFDLLPGMAPVNAGCGGNGICTAEAFIPNVPFADPGTFDLRLWVYTTGTVFNWNGVAIPITQPRVLFMQDTMQVYVTLVTLLPAGAP
ncbi:MAG: hypothetical protein QME21_04365 [Anaerolineales bacterium]|nr:hypothetical protein [Anaerolineales bacterium]